MKINFIGFLVLSIAIIALLGKGIEGYKLQNLNLNSNQQNQIPTTVVPPGVTPIVPQNIPIQPTEQTIEVRKEEVNTTPINDNSNNVPPNDKADANSELHKKKHSALKSINTFGKQACEEYCTSMGLKSSVSSLSNPSKNKQKKNATLFGVICVCEGGNNNAQSEIKEEIKKEAINQPVPSEAPKQESLPIVQNVLQQPQPPKKEGEQQQMVNATTSRSISSSIATPPITQIKK